MLRYSISLVKDFVEANRNGLASHQDSETLLNDSTMNIANDRPALLGRR